MIINAGRTFFVELLSRLVCQLTVSFHKFLDMSFHVLGRRKHDSVIINNLFAHFTLSLSASQVYMIKERCWINFFSEYFPHRMNVLFTSSKFDDIHIHRKEQLFYDAPISIPNWKPSPNSAAMEVSRITFHIKMKVLPKDDRSGFKGTTVSSILDNDLGHLCRGKRVQMSGHSDFVIFSNFGESSIFIWAYANTASAAFTAQPDSLDMISMTFVAVICDADEFFSISTAYDPESSFSTCPRRTTRPLYFGCFASNSAFFKWQISINEAKWIEAPFVLVSSITSFLLLTFLKFHAEIFSYFSHSLSTAAFAAGFFNVWGE